MSEEKQTQSEEFDYTEYARKMRLALSDKNIAKSDGTLNHQYFLVKKGQYWNEDMTKELYKGLSSEGIGNWKAIQKNELKQTSEIELELRTCLVLGISDIQKYIGQKMTKEQLEAEKEANLKQAKQLNKLRYGIYML